MYAMMPGNAVVAAGTATGRLMIGSDGTAAGGLTFGKFDTFGTDGTAAG